MAFRPDFVPWNTDGTVLLRRAACDNAEKPELPDVLASGMKFTPFLAPDSRALLDFRVTVRAADCPHCGFGGALIAHGFLRGLAATGHEPTTRAQRFFAPTGIQK